MSETDDWRTGLRRKIGWLFAAKLAALLALWLLFFAPWHRVEVTEASAGRHLALPAQSNDAEEP